MAKELVKSSVPVRWYYPEDIVTRYATSLVVQRGEHEFVLSFFEILLPLVFGTPEEQKAKLEKIDAVQATCIARIVVSAEKMPAFVKVLQEHLEKLSASIDAGSEE